MHILVVDDDANSRDGLAELLTFEGYVVDTCADGPAALARLGESSFDVLLTDYVMPEMTGVELIDAARVTTPTLRCLIMSGHARVGPADIVWVPKPIDVERLLLALGR